MQVLVPHPQALAPNRSVRPGGLLNCNPSTWRCRIALGDYSRLHDSKLKASLGSMETAFKGARRHHRPAEGYILPLKKSGESRKSAIRNRYSPLQPAEQIPQAEKRGEEATQRGTACRWRGAASQGSPGARSLQPAGLCRGRLHPPDGLADCGSLCSQGPRSGGDGAAGFGLRSSFLWPWLP